MSVTREYGEKLATQFKDELLLNIIGIPKVEVHLTGSLAVCAQGNDVDVVVFVNPDHLDATIEYMAKHFEHCGEGTYGTSCDRSVWRRGDLNVILLHTVKEYAAWLTALNLMLTVYLKTGVAPDRELRVKLHEACRGDHLAEFEHD